MEQRFSSSSSSSSSSSLGGVLHVLGECAWQGEDYLVSCAGPGSCHDTHCGYIRTHTYTLAPVGLAGPSCMITHTLIHTSGCSRSCTQL